MRNDAGDFAMMPEVEARARLSGRRVRLTVLAPFGAWAGRGTLRVLRTRTLDDDAVDLDCGYESYERLENVR
ncbi:MAG: hypothetical protein M3R51_02930 [Candidatus Eremiobacteraeota bacterium]|nr:hypothetical protein [Candidatus Eremiobacteraeota bacterium]